MSAELQTIRAKISGETINVNIVGGSVSIGANISGQTIRLTNDGINNVVSVSNTINASISGQTVRLANDGINNVTKISGETVSLAATTIVTAAMLAPIGTSGGTQLPSQACKSVTLRSVSGNNVMFIGGVGTHAPFSGKGLELYGGEAKTFFVTNFNLLSIFAVTGGQNVSLIGEQ